MVGKKNMNYENIRRITAKQENVFCPMSEFPTGREKASKTMQLAKKGKFITDLNQGSCRASNTVGTGSESPEQRQLPKFIR